MITACNFEIVVVTLTCGAAESYAVNRALSELTEGNLFQGLFCKKKMLKQVQYDDRVREIGLETYEVSAAIYPYLPFQYENL